MTVLKHITADEIDRNREVLTDWLRTHNINPDDVLLQPVTIENDGGPSRIHYRVCKRGPDGRILTDPSGDGPWTEPRSVVLVAPLPDLV